MKIFFSSAAIIFAIWTPTVANATVPLGTRAFVQASVASLDDRNGNAFGQYAPVTALVIDANNSNSSAASSVAIARGAVVESQGHLYKPNIGFHAIASFSYNVEVNGPSNIIVPINFKSLAEALITPLTIDPVFSEAFLYAGGQLIGGACSDAGAYSGECKFDKLEFSRLFIDRTLSLATRS